VRDAANTSWVTLLKLDGTPGPAILALINAMLPLAGGTMLGPLVLAGAPTTGLHAATKTYVDATSRPAPLRFLVQGNASVASKIAQALVEQDCKLTDIWMYGETAPVGAGLTVTLTRKRVSVADDSRSATIATGTNAIHSVVGSPMALLAGDRVQLGITSVGSTTPGGNALLVTGTLAPP